MRALIFALSLLTIPLTIHYNDDIPTRTPHSIKITDFKRKTTIKAVCAGDGTEINCFFKQDGVVLSKDTTPGSVCDMHVYYGGNSPLYFYVYNAGDIPTHIECSFSGEL